MIGLSINSRSVTLFLISSIVLSLFVQLDIFWQLYLIELLGFLIVVGLLGLQHLTYPKLYPKLLQKLKSCEVLCFILSFLSERQLRVVLDGNSSKEYPVNAGVPPGSILVPLLFLLHMTFTTIHDHIMNFLIILPVILLLYLHLAFDLCKQLKLTSKLWPMQVI